MPKVSKKGGKIIASHIKSELTRTARGNSQRMAHLLRTIRVGVQKGDVTAEEARDIVLYSFDLNDQAHKTIEGWANKIELSIDSA